MSDITCAHACGCHSRGEQHILIACHTAVLQQDLNLYRRLCKGWRIGRETLGTVHVFSASLISPEQGLCSEVIHMSLVFTTTIAMLRAILQSAICIAHLTALLSYRAQRQQLLTFSQEMSLGGRMRP